MHAMFEIAGGSVPGHSHALAGRNNQDAYAWQCGPQALLAVVCDGCGSSAHSEVGAQVGARLVLEAMQRALPVTGSGFWEHVSARLLAQLGALASQLGGSLSRTVADYLLFTIVGALVTPEETWVFGLGDGVIAVNDTVVPLGPWPHNAPPYLAYGLLEAAPPLQPLQHWPTATVQSLLLGSDGLDAFLQDERLGSLPQFWQEDRYFRNPDTIRRRLAVLNREVIRPDWAAQRLTRCVGPLRDDTTLVVLRRRRMEGGDDGRVS